MPTFTISYFDHKICRVIREQKEVLGNVGLFPRYTKKLGTEIILDSIAMRIGLLEICVFRVHIEVVRG